MKTTRPRPAKNPEKTQFSETLRVRVPEGFTARTEAIAMRKATTPAQIFRDALLAYLEAHEPKAECLNEKAAETNPAASKLAKRHN